VKYVPVWESGKGFPFDFTYYLLSLSSFLDFCILNFHPSRICGIPCFKRVIPGGGMTGRGIAENLEPTRHI